MNRLRKRDKRILNALTALGKEGSTREIAILANMNPNGVSQTLGMLVDKGFVTGVGLGKGSDFRWRLRGDYAN